jgi:hypothetical protein
MGTIRGRDVATGAATGATVGSAIPGIGTLAGGAIGGAGGLLYDLLSNNDADSNAVAQANAAKLAAMQAEAQKLDAMRPEIAQRTMNMTANRMSALQGANNVLATLYGPSVAGAPNLGLGLSPETLASIAKGRSAPVTYPTAPAVVSAPPPGATAQNPNPLPVKAPR